MFQDVGSELDFREAAVWGCSESRRTLCLVCQWFGGWGFYFGVFIHVGWRRLFGEGQGSDDGRGVGTDSEWVVVVVLDEHELVCASRLWCRGCYFKGCDVFVFVAVWLCSFVPFGGLLSAGGSSLSCCVLEGSRDLFTCRLGARSLVAVSGFRRCYSKVGEVWCWGGFHLAGVFPRVLICFGTSRDFWLSGRFGLVLIWLGTDVLVCHGQVTGVEFRDVGHLHTSLCVVTT